MFLSLAPGKGFRPLLGCLAPLSGFSKKLVNKTGRVGWQRPRENGKFLASARFGGTQMEKEKRFN
jgi:hypothetical protein